MIHNVFVSALLDTRASHSFISYNCFKVLDLKVSMLQFDLKVSIVTHFLPIN